MNMTLKTAALALATSIALPAVAPAQTNAVATTDLNIRAGPGPQYPVVGVIEGNGSVTINGCLDNSKWCQVVHDGTMGWSYSDYLAADMSGTQVVVTEGRADIGVPVVTYEADEEDSALVGAAGGAITGALIGGPVGAVVGGAAGAGVAAIIDPPPEPVRTYVTENAVEPVYLEGEVVVGAGVPEPVELRPVPDYDYQYVYINGQPVLVDPATRQIVYVYR